MSDDTTITVRGVDLKTWKEFQKSLIEKYGSLHGYIGTEITNAIKDWLKEEKSQFENMGGKMVRMQRAAIMSGTGSYKNYIIEAMDYLGGEATTQEVSSHIYRKHGYVNPNTISTEMSDNAVNGPPSSTIPMKHRFLERVKRGRYRLLGRALS